MDGTDREELRLLRARAWGPNADIADDATARERLRALEDLERSSRVGERDASDIERTSRVAVDPSVTDEADDGASGSEPDVEPSRRRRSAVLAFLRTRRGLRAVMWASTLLVVLVLAATTLTLVQRVQAAPLVPSAQQAARLTVVEAFERPEFFGNRGGDEPPLIGFTELAGLQALVAPDGGGYFSTESAACIYVYQTSDVRDSATSIAGQVWGGCGAGGFPATAQFVVNDQNSESVRETFTEGTALQFVFDPATSEVVVFQLPPDAVEATSAVS